MKYSTYVEGSTVESTYCESGTYLGLELGDGSLFWKMDTLFLVAEGLEEIMVE